jgi:hypothetical protein
MEWLGLIVTLHNISIILHNTGVVARFHVARRSFTVLTYIVVGIY